MSSATEVAENEPAARYATVSDATLRELAGRAVAAEAAFVAMPGNPTRAYWAARRAALDAIGALAGEMMPEVVLSLLDRAATPDWMGEVLNMVLERLQCYLGPDAIAPMFYDDAITAVAHRAAFGKLPEEMYPDGSLLHRLRESEARVATLEARLRAAERELTGCCAKCGWSVKVEAGPVNDIVCTHVEARCACAPASLNLWPKAGTAATRAAPRGDAGSAQ